MQMLKYIQLLINMYDCMQHQLPISGCNARKILANSAVTPNQKIQFEFYYFCLRQYLCPLGLITAIYHKEFILLKLFSHLIFRFLKEIQQQYKMKLIFFSSFLVLIILLNGQQYEASIDFPFLLSNQNILSINQDWSSNFWVTFSDGTVRKYDPTLSSFSTIPYSSKVQSMRFFGNQFDYAFSNGTNISSLPIYQLTVSNNSTAINFHDYTNYSLLSSYQLNDTIIWKIGYSLQDPSGSISPYVIVFCTHSMLLLFKQQVYSIYNYGSIFGQNIIALSAKIVGNGNIGQQILGGLQFDYNFSLSLNNSNVYLISAIVTFQLNSITNTFELANLTATYSLMVSLTQSIITMDSTYNNILLMQSVSHNFYFYDTSTNYYGIGSPNMSNFIMIELIETGSGIYVLTKTALIKISFASNTLTFLSIANMLPNNNYYVEYGGYFDLLYVIGGPNVYKASLCINQSNYKYNSKVCEPYNCFSGCSYCPLNNVTCGICESGYSRNDNFACIGTHNSTYQTSAQPNFPLKILDIQIVQLFIQSLQRLLETTIQIPGARAVITPIFYLFGNFDDLYLYQFHDRNYSSVMIDFFNQLNNLQEKKWNLFNYTEVISTFGNVDSFNDFTNFQQQYQQFKYSYNSFSANQSEGLFYNSQSYFLIVLPITFGYFALFHILFRFLSNYSISKLLRSYYFFLFLLIIQMDGNVQQLVFYLAREYISVFAFTFYHKLLKLAIIYYGFLLIFMSCTIFYFARLLYKNTSQVLMQYNRPNKIGIFIAVFQFGLRNIVLSFIHFFGRYLSNKILVTILLIFQFLTIFIIAVILFKNIFKEKLKICFIVFLSLTRFALIVTLMIDFQGNSEIIGNYQIILFIVMIGIFSIGIVSEVVQVAKFYITFFIKNGMCKGNKNSPNSKQIIQQDHKQQSEKQNTKTKVIEYKITIRGMNKNKTSSLKKKTEKVAHNIAPTSNRDTKETSFRKNQKIYANIKNTFNNNRNLNIIFTKTEV